MEAEREIRVLGMAGSLRAGSYNRALLASAVELAPGGMRLEAWDGLRDLPFYDAGLDTDEQRPAAVVDLKRRVAEADGVLVVTPEYNASVPGVLKNAIDWASRPGHRSPFAGKPVGMMGAANGLAGTARAQMHLREILFSLLSQVYPHPGVQVAQSPAKFQDGRLADPAARDFVAAYLSGFAAFVRSRLR
ncbi:MAG TPA: NAD(P)H-dependent oxidoreductase [Longimicrobium sp.]|nr:NAD(P)H-dependent oxidoreductase [Longimicrobium sp.]